MRHSLVTRTCGRKRVAAPGRLGLVAFAAAAFLSSGPLTGGRAGDEAIAATPEAVCDLYAAPWGRNGGRGTAEKPFRTAQRLADALRAGQVGCLRGGTYKESWDGYVLDLERSGKPGKPIRIQSVPRERARLVGTVHVPEEADHIVLSHLAFEGTGAHNTIKIYSTAVVLEDNDITNAGRGKSCLMLGNVSHELVAAETVVRRNRFHDCGSTDHDNKDHAIYVSNARGTKILQNVFWNTAGYTIHMYPASRSAHVAYNVIDGGSPSVRGGVIFAGDDDNASSDNVIEHNVVAYAETSNITSDWNGPTGESNVVRRNCLWSAKEHEIDDSQGGFVVTANVVAPPLFVSRARRDYRLRRDSRCRGVLGRIAAARVGTAARR
jgi:hypothetical protein